MTTENVKLSSIKTNKSNPRKMSDIKADRLIDSLLVFPNMLELRPIVIDAKGIVLGGNMRYKALQKIATWKMVDVITRLRRIDDYHALSNDKQDDLQKFWQAWLEHPTVTIVRAEALTEAEKRQFIIKDNASYGEWDLGALQKDWADIDLSLWGVDIDLSFGEAEDDSAHREAEDDSYSEADEKKAPQRVKRGDIWLLGEHRVMCGDSTSGADVSLLMDGEKADICFTSPPYNLHKGFNNSHIDSEKHRAYITKDHRVYDKYSDDLSDEEYSKFLCDTFALAMKYSYDVFFNIGTTAGALHGTADFLGRNAKYFAGIISWKKSEAFTPSFDVQYGILKNIQEPIYIFNDRGQRKAQFPQWGKGYALENYFESKNASNNEYSEHHATFPVELPAHFIKNFTQGSVLDIFGGTGTTLIAAEQLGRKCFMMELSERYCDIILDRWEKLTGKTAEKVG